MIQYSVSHLHNTELYIINSQGGIIISIEERHQKILSDLHSQGKITAREIQLKYQVSFDTARRDLRMLESRNLLQRTHGGALPNAQISHSHKEQDILCESSTLEINSPMQSIMMKAAAELVEKDVIFLNDPQISNLLFQNLPLNFHLTVVTNSIIVAQQLRSSKNVQLFLRGGELNDDGSCLDHLTIDSISKMRFDKCLITSTSISARFGLSMQSNYSIDLINTVIGSSKKAIGLYTSDKIGYESILKICPANKLDVLITNINAPNYEIYEFENLDVKVILA